MRPTVESEMLMARAMVLRDQCVALAGVLYVVLAITSETMVAEIVGIRTGLGASFKRPSTPSAIKRPRHRATILGVTPICVAICLFCNPSQPKGQCGCAAQRVPESNARASASPVDAESL
jgi:hypothetical protein